MFYMFNLLIFTIIHIGIIYPSRSLRLESSFNTIKNDFLFTKENCETAQNDGKINFSNVQKNLQMPSSIKCIALKNVRNAELHHEKDLRLKASDLNKLNSHVLIIKLLILKEIDYSLLLNTLKVIFRTIFGYDEDQSKIKSIVCCLISDIAYREANNNIFQIFFKENNIPANNYDRVTKLKCVSRQDEDNIISMVQIIIFNSIFEVQKHFPIVKERVYKIFRNFDTTIQNTRESPFEPELIQYILEIIQKMVFNHIHCLSSYNKMHLCKLCHRNESNKYYQECYSNQNVGHSFTCNEDFIKYESFFNKIWIIITEKDKTFYVEELYKVFWNQLIYALYEDDLSFKLDFTNESDLKYCKFILFCQQQIKKPKTIDEIDFLMSCNEKYETYVNRFFYFIANSEKYNLKENSMIIHNENGELLFNDQISIPEVEQKKLKDFFELKKCNFYRENILNPIGDEHLSATVDKNLKSILGFYTENEKSCNNKRANFWGLLKDKFTLKTNEKKDYLSIRNQIILENKNKSNNLKDKIYCEREYNSDNLSFFKNELHQCFSTEKVFSEKISTSMIICFTKGISQLIYNEMIGIWNIDFETIENIVGIMIREKSNMKKRFQQYLDMFFSDDIYFSNIYFFTENYEFISETFHSIAEYKDF